ncbi:hypothetical protein RM549_04425 [Salegentibacter sp. F188]|uniref:Uncharacterized protein n=1 Tax=Autumnicola patrickiae TaxID=3075591 RepID=A0ABU3DZ76_9FLAO|nr:hypothetical protein [Salegentibacter sp. F188]MDT0689017.1 hypothetical protein [Salegentibacter sp. F188]
MMNSSKRNTKTSNNTIKSKPGRILLILLLLTLIYPVWSYFQLQDIEGETAVNEYLLNSIQNYLVSIWISWLVFVGISVFWKWTREENIFFYFTYGFLLLAWAVLGVYVQDVNYSGSNASGGMAVGNYPVMTMMVLQHFVASVVLTIFLQISSWWFTRRWHRR